MTKIFNLLNLYREELNHKQILFDMKIKLIQAINIKQCILLMILLQNQWFANSGASNHYTPFGDNIQQSMSYSGGDNLYVGNRTCLDISLIGKSSFDSTLFCFLLTDILHTPSLTKNLLSVSKFTRDNSCFFKFHPDICFIKDLQTKKVLLQGKLHKGRYAFQIPWLSSLNKSTLKSCNISHITCKNVSVHHDLPHSIFDTWQRSLDHRSPRIVKIVMNKCNLSCSIPISSICSTF